MKVSLVESFLSIQGEGPSVGEPAMFLRLAGCNLACDWCDTPYSWDWKRFDRTETVQSLSTELLATKVASEVPASVKLLVVTGGEPLVQRGALVELIRLVQDLRPDMRVEVETNGSIPPGSALARLVHLFVVSPKLANAGVSNVVSVDTVRPFSVERAVLKFVVRTAQDVDDAAGFATEAGFAPGRVWVMPEGTDAPTIAAHGRATAPRAIDKGFRVSPRLQIALWGDERGY